MNRRYQFLIELGITPIWVLRDAGHTNILDLRSSQEILLDEDYVREIDICDTCVTRQGEVPSQRDLASDWFLVEDRSPYAGDQVSNEQESHLLSAMLAAISLENDKNVCMVSVNAACESCISYMCSQIELTGPKIILVFGELISWKILETKKSIENLRGKIYFFEETPLVVTYRPSYLFNNPSVKPKAWEDLCFAESVMNNKISIEKNDRKV